MKHFKVKTLVLKIEEKEEGERRTGDRERKDEEFHLCLGLPLGSASQIQKCGNSLSNEVGLLDWVKWLLS